jgi:hypothetical protein
MGSLCQPRTSPQDIDGGRGEKGLKPKLFPADIPGAAHFTGAHGLGYGPFYPCSCGILCTKLRGSFTVASFLKRLIRLFVRLEDQHPCRALRAVIMERTRPANCLREAHSHDRFPMAIANGPPTLTGVCHGTRYLAGLPIDGELAVIKAHTLSRLPTQIWHDWTEEIHLIAVLTLGEDLCINITHIYQMLIRKHLLLCELLVKTSDDLPSGVVAVGVTSTIKWGASASQVSVKWTL